MTLDETARIGSPPATAGRVAQASNHADDPEALSMVVVHDEN
jgi:hypothetical protein